MALHPQAQAALKILIETASIDTRMSGEQIHALMASMPVSEAPPLFGSGDDVRLIENRAIEGPAGDLRLRLYHPFADQTAALPILLFVHGGGFVFGAPEQHDNICRSLAQRAQCVVVSVDYRLAPEARFPAALDDTVAALKWAAANAGSIGGDADRIAVAGDSAGGNLAALAALQAGVALRHQLLFYPVIEARFDTRAYRQLGRDYYLTTELMQWFWDQYLPRTASPDAASPLRQPDLKRAPATTIHTAEFDPLSGEGLDYALALKEAGVDVKHRCWPGQIHGFASMLGVVDAADEVLTQSAAALRAAFR